MNIELSPHKDYQDQAKRFIDLYDIIDFMIPSESNYKSLKLQSERACRFCGRSHSNTKFKKRAHLIPEMLGNKFLFSDFECDECNYYFGSLENDLANYLGISRTIKGLEGKNKVPKFKSANNAIEAKRQTILNNPAVIISREDINNGAISVNRQRGEVVVKFKKNPFSPLNVYKAFLKIALSIIEDNAVRSDYKLAIEYLLSSNKSKITGCLISGFQLPFQYNLPLHYILFKKKDYNTKAHSHVLALYFQNLIFAFPVPLNKNDLQFYKNDSPINIHLYPPLFTQFTNLNDLTFKPFLEDFSNEDKVRNLEDEITFTINPDDLLNSAVFNSVTKEFNPAEFNPSEIVKIIMGPADTGSVEVSDIFNQVNEK